MSYAQPSDIVSRFPNRDLVQLTNEDPSAQTVNTDFLQTYLDDASNKMDMYFESRLTLPLQQNIPASLIAICIDIAMYLIQALRPEHDLADARKRYEDALKVLQQFKDGKLTLGLSVTGAEPTSQPDDAVSIAGGGLRKRMFTRKTMEGM